MTTEAEMRVTNKKGVGFYVRAASTFLKGVDAQPASEGKEAVEAKEPVMQLVISGVGEAINIAVSTALKVEAESLGTIAHIDTLYPDMPSGRGCAQIKIHLTRGTPFLHEAFRKLNAISMEHQKKLFEVVRESARLDRGFKETEKEVQKLTEVSKDRVRKEVVPIAEKSFKHHDFDGNDTLDQEESMKFFGAFMSESTSIMAACFRAQLLPECASAIMGNLPAHLRTPENEANLKKAIPAIVKAVDDKVDEMMKDYLANKKDNDDAAFKVLNTSGDGKVTIAEFLSLFDGEGDSMLSKKSGRFLEAAGFRGFSLQMAMNKKLKELFVDPAAKAKELADAEKAAAAAKKDKDMSEKFPELGALFQQAHQAGLSDTSAIHAMWLNVESGRFTAEHYVDMWKQRLSK